MLANRETWGKKREQQGERQGNRDREKGRQREKERVREIETLLFMFSLKKK